MARTPKTRRTVKTSTAAPKAPAQKKTASKKQVAAAPKPKMVNAHAELKHGYAGPSAPVNANRPTKIMVRETPTALTDRMKATLYALRRDNKGEFPARGLDNGVVSNLIAAGMLNVMGGQVENIGGKDYRKDGSTPVTLTVSVAGQRYGQA